jgi:hypothetical protein
LYSIKEGSEVVQKQVGTGIQAYSRLGTYRNGQATHPARHRETEGMRQAQAYRIVWEINLPEGCVRK